MPSRRWKSYALFAALLLAMTPNLHTADVSTRRPALDRLLDEQW